MKLLCPEAHVVPEAGVDANGCRVSIGCALVQCVQRSVSHRTMASVSSGVCTTEWSPYPEVLGPRCGVGRTVRQRRRGLRVGRTGRQRRRGLEVEAKATEAGV